MVWLLLGDNAQQPTSSASGKFYRETHMDHSNFPSSFANFSTRVLAPLFIDFEDILELVTGLIPRKHLKYEF